MVTDKWAKGQEVNDYAQKKLHKLSLGIEGSLVSILKQSLVRGSYSPTELLLACLTAGANWADEVVWFGKFDQHSDECRKDDDERERER